MKRQFVLLVFLCLLASSSLFARTDYPTCANPKVVQTAYLNDDWNDDLVVTCTDMSVQLVTFTVPFPVSRNVIFPMSPCSTTPTTPFFLPSMKNTSSDPPPPVFSKVV